MNSLSKILLLLFAIVLLPPMPATARAIDRTIAKINDTLLTESDLAEVIAEIHGLHQTTGIEAFSVATSETVTSMLDRALLLQEAKRLQIVPTDEEMHRQVEEMVREIRANFASEKNFYQALAEERLSLDQLKEQLIKRTRDDFMVYHVVDSRYSIPDAELKKMKSEGGVSRSASLRLRRMGVAITKKVGRDEASRQARALVAKTITDGISFEEGVRRYSQVSGAAEDGGDMGYVALDKLSAEVRGAVENLDVGQASAPVVAGEFANVFYVEGKRGERVALREQKFVETRDELLKSLRRRAVLQVFDDRLRSLLIPEYLARVTGHAAAEPTQTQSPAAPETASAAPQQPGVAPQSVAPTQPTPAQPRQTPARRTFWQNFGRRQ